LRRGFDPTSQGDDLQALKYLTKKLVCLFLVIHFFLIIPMVMGCRGRRKSHAHRENLRQIIVYFFSGIIDKKAFSPCLYRESSLCKMHLQNPLATKGGALCGSRSIGSGPGGMAGGGAFLVLGKVGQSLPFSSFYL
jgi:hypothetical protein